MEPLIVLIAVTAGLLVAGALGVRRVRPWPVALRGGLAAMFVLTGVSHFVGMREELIAMVPPGLPAPGLLVTITGVLELAGAVGLLLRPTAPWAAGCLSALLVAMYPANAYAAIEGLTTGTWDALLPRTLLQVLFVAVAVTVTVTLVRQRRATRATHTARAVPTTAPTQEPEPAGR